MSDNQLDLRLKQEIGMFRNLWKGGFFEGDPLDPFGFSGYSFFGFMNVLHVTYLMCIKPYVHGDSAVLEIGPGRGGWTRCFLNAKEVWCLDALSAEHNKFYDYVGRHDQVKYVQVEDFSCRDLPDNRFDYFFSFGCFCHISPMGIQEYLKNLFPKLKSGCHGFIMVADYDKFNAAVAEFKKQLQLSRYFQRRLCIYLPVVLMARLANRIDPRKHLTVRDKNQGDQPYPGRWYHLGTKEACAMLESLGYRVVEADVGVNHRDPVIHFRKP
jgi:phospholipid N-methyltransferase